MKIESIFSQTAKIKIIRVLISNYMAYTLNDLKIMTGSSIGSIHASIRDLLGEKIIIQLKGKGKQKYYKLNRDCPKELINLFELEKYSYAPVPVNIWNNIISLTDMIKKNKGIRLILLYGSYARGEQRPDSDIDILVVSKTKVKVQTKIKDISILNLLETEYNDMSKNKSELYEEIMKSSIVLWENDR